MTERVEIGPHVLYWADCRDVLDEIGRVDAVVMDPPYSKRTHSGHDASANGHLGAGKDNAVRTGLGYQYLHFSDVWLYAKALNSVCTGWIVWMTDHVLAMSIDDALIKLNRYVFAPLPYYAPGSRVRLSGDGPSSWTIWIVVSRPSTKEFSRWGTLPGGYVNQGWNDTEIIGGKPTKLMEALVRDYSRSGDIVLDPFMGAGTTGIACVNLGRRFIGIEINQEHFDLSCKRIEYAHSQLRLFA